MSAAGAMARGQRAAALGLWLAAVALAAWVVARASYTADLSAFLPRSPDARQQLLIAQLQSGLASRTLLIGIEGGTVAARAEASRSLAAALRASGLFEQVQNGERAAFAEVGRWLFEHRYALSPAVAPGRFSAEGLREALADTLSLLGTPAGAAAREVLPRDPTGEMPRIVESLIPAQAPRLEGGVWMSRQAARAVLLASTKAEGADLDAQQAAVQRVHAAFAALSTGAPLASLPAASAGGSRAGGASSPPGVAGGAARGLTLQLSGPPLFAVQSRAVIHREVHWLGAAGAAVVALLLLAAFASPRALASAMLPVASGVLAGIAAVALGFGHVHGMTLGFGATLIGESVDYAIYYLVQARRGAAAGGAGRRTNGAPGAAAAPGWRQWLASGWPTMRLGVATSVCGFAALLFSGFPGLAQLGLFSIAGLVGAALTTRWLLPVLLPDGAPGTGVRAALGRATGAALAALPRLKGAVLALGAAALVLLALRADLWRADLAALSPLPREALALDAALRADLGASDARTLVVVQGEDIETTLQRAEAAAARLETLVERGQLGGFDSVTRWLPSRATQERRRASLPEPAALPALFAQAAQGTPLAPQAAALAASFAAEVERARAAGALTAEAVAASPAKPLAEALLLRSASGGAGPGRYTALLPLQAAPAASAHGQIQTQTQTRTQPQAQAQDQRQGRALAPPAPGTAPAAEAGTAGERGIDAAAVAAALDGLPETQALDVKAELDRLYQHYLREALWQAVLGAAAVVALMALVLRDARRTLAVCQPLALAVLLVLAGLAVAGVSLGILHLVGLLLVVAVGSNYALFFDQVQHAAAAQGAGAAAAGGAAAAAAFADTDTLASLLLANLTTVATFALLAFSRIPALAAIGSVVAPGALLALLLAAVFARPAWRGAGKAGG